MQHRQRCLGFGTEESLENLWPRFSEDQRREVIARYASLLAQSLLAGKAEKADTKQDQEEGRDERSC